MITVIALHLSVNVDHKIFMKTIVSAWYFLNFHMKGLIQILLGEPYKCSIDKHNREPVKIHMTFLLYHTQ